MEPVTKKEARNVSKKAEICAVEFPKMAGKKLLLNFLVSSLMIEDFWRRYLNQ